MSKLVSRLKDRLSGIAHSVRVWSLLHAVGMWHDERIGAHGDWEQVTCGPLSLSLEGCHFVDCCSLTLGLDAAPLPSRWVTNLPTHPA